MEDRQLLLSGLFCSATTPDSLQKIPYFKSLLQDLVPERFEGDIENKLQHFFSPLNKCSLFELNEFHLYFLSNNKFTEAQADNLLKFIAKQKPLGPLKSFLQMKTPTTKYLCDKILEFTIRRRDVTGLPLLIACGIDRSALSGTQGGKYQQIPLALAKLGIVEYLLDIRVNVNPPLGEFPYSQLLLEAEANVDNDRLGDLLLLDWVYLHKRHLYNMILSRSQHAKRSLTTIGILYAANASSWALS